MNGRKSAPDTANTLVLRLKICNITFILYRYKYVRCACHSILSTWTKDFDSFYPHRLLWVPVHRYRETCQHPHSHMANYWIIWIWDGEWITCPHCRFRKTYLCFIAGGYRGGFIFPFFAAGVAFGRALCCVIPGIPIPLACLSFAAAIFLNPCSRSVLNMRIVEKEKSISIR